MQTRQKTFNVVAVLALTSAAVGALMILVLYGTAYRQIKNSLIEKAAKQANLMEAVAEFDLLHSAGDVEGGAIEATLSQIRRAQVIDNGFGNSGEFILGRVKDGKIQFILSDRQHEWGLPPSIPLDSEAAAPMRRALRGLSGTIEALDHRKIKVLAAYQPVKTLELGLVAKIDIAEIREPFIRAGLIGILFGAIFVGIGTALIYRINKPIAQWFVDRARELEKEISRREHYEKVLIESKDEALQASRAKSMFLANISHEIHTPLNGIQGSLYLLNNTRLDQKQRKYLKMAETSNADLSALLSNVLNFSKIEAGQIELDQQFFDIRELVENSAAQLMSQADQQGLNLSFFVEPDVPSLVKGDSERLDSSPAQSAEQRPKVHQQGRSATARDLQGKAKQQVSASL